MMGEIIVRSRRTFQSWGFYLRRILFSILSVGPIPAHIAFIMDGNRRYAKKMNLEEGAGHKVGFLTLLSILKYCYELGVKYTTVYAFSIDNFKRSPEEVQLVMNLLLEKIEGLLKEESIVNQYGVRVYFIGNMKLMDEAVRSAAEKAMKATANNKRSVLLVCLAYTSSDEIVNSVQESCIEKWRQIHALGHQNGEIHAFVSRNVEGKKGDEEEDLGDIEAADSDHQNGEIQAFVNGNVERKKEEEEEDIGDLKVADIERHMHMAVAPDPDILIRSSGETRLSNFLLWQTSNCVLLCPRALWPEMGLWHLVSAVLSFQRNYPYIEKKKKQV